MCKLCEDTSEKYSNVIDVIYGDTDSIFLDKCAPMLEEGENNNRDFDIRNESKADMVIDQMQTIFKGVEISKDIAWKIIAFGKNEKEYFGLDYDDKIKMVGIKGMSVDKPRYYDISENFIIKTILELFAQKETNSELNNKKMSIFLDKVKEVFDMLKLKISADNNDDAKFIENELAYSIKPTISFKDIDSQGITNTIYAEKLAEEISPKYPDKSLDKIIEHARSCLVKGKRYKYYKIEPVKPVNDLIKARIKDYQKVSIFPTKYKLDVKKYCEELFTVLYPVLTAVGITDTEKELKERLGILPGNTRNNKMNKNQTKLQP